MTRKYNPGLYVGLVNKWQAEEVQAAASVSTSSMAKKRSGKVDLLLPLKRAWRYFLRQEEKARTAFVLEFYPEATGADLARATFYRELLEGTAAGLALIALYAMAIICFA